jgi:hypothetical protein
VLDAAVIAVADDRMAVIVRIGIEMWRFIFPPYRIILDYGCQIL